MNVEYIVNKVREAYLDAAIFTEEERLAEGGEYGGFSISAQERAWDDCERFLKEIEERELDVGCLTWEQIGHNIWFTRNGHGVGFWDMKVIPHSLGLELTEIAQRLGSVDLVVGDDGQLYFE